MNTRPEEILPFVREPIELGNPVAFAERLVAHYRNPAWSLLRGLLLQEFDHAFSHGGRTAEEIAGIRKAVAGIPKLAAQARALEPASQHIRPGRLETGCALAVLVSGTEGAAFGTVQEVRAGKVEDSKGSFSVTPDPGKNSDITQSVYTARLAALTLSAGLGYLPDEAQALTTVSFHVQVGTGIRELSGPSIGLAAAIAIVSALLKKKVPRDIAFTGQVMVNGAITPVGGLEEKVEAVRLKGLKLFIPADNHADLPLKHRKLTIPVTHLNEVVGQVFDMNLGSTFTGQLSAGTSSRVIGLGAWARQARGKRIVLLSMVGGRDPFSAPDRDLSDLGSGDSRMKMEGPVLTAARWLAPLKVVLFVSGEKEMSDRAKRTATLVRQILPDCRVDDPMTLKITDPTDYDGIHREMKRQLAALRETLTGFSRRHVFLSISSGTPQMHAVLLHLVRSGALPARIIQTLAPRHTGEGKDRVRFVRSKLFGL